MAQKRLFLHIGARKTGSSMLQTMFARNTENFLRQGLYYPIGDRERAHVARGITTSGNGGLLMKTLRPDVVARASSHVTHDDTFLEVMERSPCSKMLISSEYFCAARVQSLQRFRALAQSAGAGVEFIYYVRNPLDHAFSEWTQHIKSGTVAREWREYLRNYTMPFAGVIRRFAEHFGGTMHVLNYDYYRSDLLKAACDIMGVVADISPGDLRVNRSPTKAEAELLVHAHRYLAATDVAARTKTKITQIVYKHLIMRPVSERMRPLILDDDLQVLERNNSEGLAYVNRFVSGAPLGLHGGKVATGQLVLEPPAEDMRAILEAVLTAAVSMLKQREGAKDRRTQREKAHGSRHRNPG